MIFFALITIGFGIAAYHWGANSSKFTLTVAVVTSINGLSLIFIGYFNDSSDASLYSLVAGFVVLYTLLSALFVYVLARIHLFLSAPAARQADREEREKRKERKSQLAKKGCFREELYEVMNENTCDTCGFKFAGELSECLRCKGRTKTQIALAKARLNNDTQAIANIMLKLFGFIVLATIAFIIAT